MEHPLGSPAPQHRTTLRHREGHGRRGNICRSFTVRRDRVAKPRFIYRPLRLAWNASEQALVLLPEIALTPQTLARFEARFDARARAPLGYG